MSNHHPIEENQILRKAAIRSREILLAEREKLFQARLEAVILRMEMQELKAKLLNAFARNRAFTSHETDS